MATGIIYLANTDAGSSVMCLYTTPPTNGQAPLNAKPVTKPGSDVIWEGQAISTEVFFWFTTHVNADAAVQAKDAPVGTATQTIFAVAPPGSPPGTKAYDQWNIFKDDGTYLWIDPSLGNVHAIYYYLNISQS